MAKREKVVLAYSGGLDTSVAVQWLTDKYKMDVITLCVDLGGVTDVEGIRKKALKLGAIKSIAVDARKEFVNEYVSQAIKADALYEGQYPLATALGRPLMAKWLCRYRPQGGRICGRPRLHRQGQRPGALRRGRLCAGPGVEDHRPRP